MLFIITTVISKQIMHSCNKLKVAVLKDSKLKAIGNYFHYHAWEKTLIAFLKQFTFTNSNKSTNHNQSSCPRLSTQNIIRNIMAQSAHKTQSIQRHVLWWYLVALNRCFCHWVLHFTLNATLRSLIFKPGEGLKQTSQHFL